MKAGSLLRSLLSALAVAWLVLGVLAPSSVADDKNEFFDKTECICDAGSGACPHKLRSPKKVTDDPCWCHRCREYSKHDGSEVPFGWNPLCWTNKKEEVYLRRHAAAWDITCSICIENDDVCRQPNPQNCPNCGEHSDFNPHETDALGNPAKATVLKRLAREQQLFKKPKNVKVLYNRYFYLVTDSGSMKVKTPGGSSRVASGHEWAHLMMERAMYARREFVHHFGDQLKITLPTGIYLPAKERDAAKIQGTYLGSPRTNVLYGGGAGGSVADGFCFHGFCQSQQKFGGDHDQHMAMRHMIGHELISCWVVVNGNNRALPRWMFVGAAHWLSRLQDRFEDDCTFCANEGTAVSDSGKGWESDMARYAGSNKIDPIEKLFGKTAQGQLSVNDHKRSWSYFDLCLSQWREPFVKMCADLRRQVESREAFMKNMDVTPEVFDERWRDTVTGRRRGIGPEFDEDEFEGNDSPSARERRSLKSESDLATLAAKIRGLGTVDDPKTIEVLVGLYNKNSELVRSTLTVTLMKTKDDEALEALWQVGLYHKKPLVRAHVARLIGRLEMEYALPRLRELLEDSNWFVRAEAAMAVGLLGDRESMRALRGLVNDSAEKTRVSAMDALALFGEDSQMSVPLIMKHVKASSWQLRVVACQALGKIGSMEAVEPLIARMEVESGRVREEIRDALKEITRDDLGKQPKYWRDWWEKLKANTPGGMPGRPDAPVETEKEDPNDRYAKEAYYGIELYTSRIGFVIDTSGSMNSNFQPSPAAAKRMSREYTGTNKITICKEEVAYALKSLDRRAHFNIYSFGTRIRTFKKNPVPCSPGNISSGMGFLRSLPANGETNYYDALRAALDLGDGPDASPNFRSTPDTLTFLTDGMPTRGEMTDADTLLEWYTALNRYARIRTHVICFGTKGVDLVLLRGMAEKNAGKFVLVAESSR